jgi:hypothetical protein
MFFHSISFLKFSNFFPFQSFNINTQQWTTLSAVPASVCYNGCERLPNSQNKFLVAGFWELADIHKAYIYDAEKDTW